jgi:hypothetical protein
MFWCIIFFLLIIILIKTNRENYENINVDIGNTISDYYHKYFMSILKKEDFNYLDKNIFNNNTEVSSKNTFIDSFPKRIPFNEEIYNKLKHIDYEKYTKILSVVFWNSDSKEKQMIHSIMKPYMHKIFDETYTKLNLNKNHYYPIIHFRCADTPFNKHGLYYFQKYDYFKNILKKHNFNKIIILSCTEHLSNEQNKNSCEKYVNLLKEQLKEYNPEIKCGTNVDDFVSMFYAPLVISTQSSFSFMSGYFGNGIYIEPNTMSGDSECSDCETEYKGYNIPHSIVNDYHNIDEVYKLLI